MILFSAGNILVWVVWVAAALACLASAVAVISFSNPFYSALALIGNLGSLAVLYLLLSAEFVAAVLGNADLEFGIAPQNSLLLAQFLGRTGVVKSSPADWRDYFFPDIHQEPGS